MLKTYGTFGGGIQVGLDVRVFRVLKMSCYINFQYKNCNCKMPTITLIGGATEELWYPKEMLGRDNVGLERFFGIGVVYLL